MGIELWHEYGNSRICAAVAETGVAKGVGGVGAEESDEETNHDGR